MWAAARARGVVAGGCSARGARAVRSCSPWQTGDLSLNLVHLASVNCVNDVVVCLLLLLVVRVRVLDCVGWWWTL